MRELVTEELGSSYAPAAYLRLDDLGLDSFPMTLSGKPRKDMLKKRVLQHLQERGLGHSLNHDNAKHGEEDVLTRVLSHLLGESADTFPRDKPIRELADSINIMRFLGVVNEETSSSLTMQDVIEASDIRDLANRSRSSHGRALPGTQALSEAMRSGPPTVSDMVHTHGDDSRVLQTRKATYGALKSLDMGWQDVEDVFPVSGISLKHLRNTRPLASTLRFSFVARTADSARCRHAIEASLKQWPILRSVSVEYDRSRRLFAVLRMESKWSKLAIIDHPDVDSPSDLCELAFSPQEFSVTAPGPLLRIIIARVKSTDTAGVVLLINHAVQDAIGVSGWHEDIERLLTIQATDRPPRTPYKLFADIYYQYQTSLPAQLGLAFHVNRLMGISSSKNAIWPYQRAEDWFIGDDEAWESPNLADGHVIESGSHQRKQLDDGGWRVGYDGVTQFVHLDHLAELWSSHSISVPVLFKAACVLLNCHLTDQASAVFANSQAGRQWPFVEQDVVRYLPSPLNIAGPTFTVLMNYVSLDWNETVGTLLCRLEAEQRDLTHYTHTPMSSIVEQLSKSDGNTVIEATRQLLNWQPYWRGSVARNASSELEVVQIEGHSDRAVVWHCGMMDSNTARLLAQWDGAQLAKQDMESYVSAFLTYLEWLHKPENWYRPLNEGRAMTQFLPDQRCRPL